jgi:4-hydroxy-tetrahydrodipicolinate synthase
VAQTSEPKIHGIIAYPVTPFSEKGIDVERLAALVERLVSADVHAIAPLGSTGELAYLEEPEFDTVVDTTLATVAGRVPVIVGVSDGAPSTRSRPGPTR